MDNICLIIQGPSNNVNTIKNIYKNIAIPIIFSTWEGEESKYDKKDNVVFNSMPRERGIQNVMLQQYSTYKGLLKAKELGYEYAIKIRSDFYFTNLKKFLKNNINFTKINFLYYFDYVRVDNKINYKYVCDYIQLGSVNNLLKLWNFEYQNCKYAEQLITNHVLKTFSKNNIEFISNFITQDCDIFWIKNNLYLSNTDKNHYKTYIS